MFGDRREKRVAIAINLKEHLSILGITMVLLAALAGCIIWLILFRNIICGGQAI